MEKSQFKGNSNRIFVSLIILFFAIIPPEQLNLILCPFNLITGIHCPLCGLTRSMISAMHFDFSKSIEYHPLGIAVLMLMSIYSTRIISPLTIETINNKYVKVIQGRSFEFGAGVFLIVWILRLF